MFKAVLKHNKTRVFCQAIAVFLFSIFYFLFSIGPVRAEDINQQILDLRAQIDALTKQAAEYQGTITQKQKEAATLNSQIVILNNQILKLQTQISITGKQIDSTNLQITQINEQIYNDQQSINQKEGAMGEIVAYLYQQDRMGLLATLLKYQTLSGFTGQVQQAQDLNTKLTQLLADLKTEKSNLEASNEELNQKKADLATLNQQQINQQNSVSQTKKNKDLLLAQTKGEEAKYQQLLNINEEQQTEFFTQLQQLEKEAIKAGAYIVHVTATYVPPKGTTIFEWPFDSYILTQGYGCTTFAKCGNPRGPYGGAPHNGVDITAGTGAAIHPAANGDILASGYSDGWGNWVAIRHPELYNLVTLYAHMQSPTGLANGTAVTTKSIIGYEGKTGNTTGAHLHISVYNDFFTYISTISGQLYFNYFEGTLNPFNYLP